MPPTARCCSGSKFVVVSRILPSRKNPKKASVQIAQFIISCSLSPTSSKLFNSSQYSWSNLKPFWSRTLAECVGFSHTQFQWSSWNCYRACRKTEPQHLGEISSVLFWPNSSVVHPHDLSSCYQALLRFMFWVSCFNPLPSNPTYLMPVCITFAHKSSPQPQSKFICHALLNLYISMSMPSSDHASMSKLPTVQVVAIINCSYNRDHELMHLLHTLFFFETILELNMQAVTYLGCIID